MFFNIFCSVFKNAVLVIGSGNFNLARKSFHQFYREWFKRKNAVKRRAKTNFAAGGQI
jgi:hypothetical protein